MTVYNDDPLLFDKVSAENAPDDTGTGENCIEWIRGQNTVTVQLAGHSKFCNKVKKYAEEYPDEVQIAGENRDGSIVAHIPLKYVKITRPAERNLSDEQKQELRERLAKARTERGDKK